MSENTENEKIQIIADGALIDLKFSTGYYRRIQAMLHFLLQDKSNDEINNAHQEIKNQKIETEWVFHYETLLILCKEVESKAKEQNSVEEVTVEEFKKMMNLDDDDKDA